MLYSRADSSKLPANQRHRIETVLADLDSARSPEDLRLPGYRLHPLKGALRGFWSIRVSANYRIVFRMKDGNALDVDLVDYH
jgi:proteic killer suppression protein